MISHPRVGGFLLFLLPTGLVFSMLYFGKGKRGMSSIELGAFLALIALSFHSLGDFNLQIPGVTWQFSAIIALGLSSSLRRGREGLTRE